MATIPYLVLLPVSLTSGGSGRATLPVTPGQSLSLDRMVFQSTGAFSLTGLSTSDGRNYGNISPSSPIPSTMLASVANNFNAIIDLVPNLKIDSNMLLYVDVVDTSAAINTVRFLFMGELTIPN